MQNDKTYGLSAWYSQQYQTLTRMQYLVGIRVQHILCCTNDVQIRMPGKFETCLQGPCRLYRHQILCGSSILPSQTILFSFNQSAGLLSDLELRRDIAGCILFAMYCLQIKKLYLGVDQKWHQQLQVLFPSSKPAELHSWVSKVAFAGIDCITDVTCMRTHQLWSTFALFPATQTASLNACTCSVKPDASTIKC